MQSQKIECFPNPQIIIHSGITIEHTAPVITENIPTSTPPILEINKPRKFIPIDGSPLTQISTLLLEQEIVDSDWNPICNQEISFILDPFQKEWLEKILNNDVIFQYSKSDCTFTLKSLLEHLFEKHASSIENVCFIGGINRFLVCSSPEFCEFFLSKAGAKIPREMIKDLLSLRSYDLPDIDIRFKLKPIDPLKKQAELDAPCDDVVNFLHTQLKKKSIYIPSSTINALGLKKRQPTIFEGLAYSIIAFGSTQFEFSSQVSWAECMFVLDMKTTHLFSRDNLQIDISEYLRPSKENSKISFSSYGNQQLKASLHILLKKIALEHETDFNGLIRIVSLLTTGHTLVNSLEEFQKRFSFFASKKSIKYFVSDCSKAILKCLDNHHSHTLEVYPLFLYNLASMLDEKTREIYLIPIWKRISELLEEKNLKLSPLSSLITQLICEKKIAFELVEATIGLATTLHLCHIDANSPSPNTVLCEQGKRVHLQMALGKEYNSFFLLTPFRPEFCFQLLFNQLSQENAHSLIKLFFETKNIVRDSKCLKSLLEAYFPQFPSVFDQLFSAVSNIDKNANPSLCSIVKEVQEDFQIADLNVDTFPEKLEKASSSDERVLIWKRLCHKLSNTLIGELLKSSEKRWINVLETPFRRNKAISFWIYLLAKTGDAKLAELAIDLSKKNHLLSFAFCEQLLSLFYLQNFFCAQRLIRFIQKEKKSSFSIQEEFQLVSGMLETLKKRSSRVCGLPEVISAIGILEHFIVRCEKETSLSLNLGEPAMVFLERLFCEGFYREAKKLLQEMTKLGLLSPKEPKIKELWLGNYAVESTHKKTASIESYRLWKTGGSYKIWDPEMSCEVFLEAMTRTIEELSTVDVYEEEFSEMLSALKPSLKSKELFGNRLEATIKKVLNKHLEKKQETSLKVVQNRLVQFQKHLCSREKYNIIFSLFETSYPLKLWEKAFKFWGSLMKSKELDTHLQKIGIATGSFIDWLLKHNQFPFIAKLVSHPHFNELQSLLVNVWTNNCIKTFKFLQKYKDSFSRELQISISKHALQGITSLEIEKQKLFFLKVKIQEFFDEEQLSKQVENLVLKLIETAKNNQIIEECFNLLDIYRPKDTKSWICVFDCIENFKNPARAWQMFQIALKIIPEEDFRGRLKCLKGVVLCLKNNHSPILFEFFEELMSENSHLSPIVESQKHPKLSMKLLLIMLEGIILMSQEKLIDRGLSSKIGSYILVMTRKFEPIEDVSLINLAIVNRSVEYFLMAENFGMFITATKTVFELINGQQDLVPEETILLLLKHGARWENDPRFVESGVIQLLEGIVGIFAQPEQKNLLEITRLISLYQSEGMVYLTSNLIVYTLSNRFFSPIEMLQEMNNTRSPMSLKEMLMVDRLDEQIVHTQTDTKLGKIIIRQIIKLSESKNRDDFVTVLFLLHAKQVSQHLSLSSFSALWDRCCDMKFRYFLIEEKSSFSHVHLKELLELGRKFVKEPTLLSHWRRKIFSIVLPLAFKEDSQNIFYQAVPLILFQLTAIKLYSSVTCEEENNTGTMPFYTIKFITSKNPNEKSIKQRKEQYDVTLEFLEIMLEQYGCDIFKNSRLESFVGESLNSIFEFFYQHRLKQFDRKKLEYVVSMYMEFCSANACSRDFWDKMVKRVDYPLIFGDLFIPITIKLLSSTDPNDQAKAYCAIRSIPVAEGKVSGFPVEVVKKLYDTALNTIFRLLNESTLDQAKNYLDEFKELLLVQKQELKPLEKQVKKHLRLMESIAIDFLNRLLKSSSDKKRTEDDRLDALTYSLFFLYELNRHKKVFSSNEKYKIILTDILSVFIDKINAFEEYNIMDVMKFGNVLMTLVFDALRSQKMPDESLLLLTKNVLLNLQLIKKKEIEEIVNGYAQRFSIYLAKNYTKEICEKYSVPYSFQTTEFNFDLANISQDDDFFSYII